MGKQMTITGKSFANTFDARFFDDYGGRLIQEPRIAIIELVANSWDAGARRVDITWPTDLGGQFRITDDGSGMTKADFLRIWPELNYNRVRHYGAKATQIDGTAVHRPAYGRNGKGRLSLFCFSDQYSVETWKDGTSSTFLIRRCNDGLRVFDTIHIPDKDSVRPVNEHGTTISCKIDKSLLREDDIRNHIGSKFSRDPDFTVILNDKLITLQDLREANVMKEEKIKLPNGKTIDVFVIESIPGRTSMTQGIAWWVNGRLVGEPSWKGVIDGRIKPSRTLTFIVRADSLIDEIKADWMDFNDSPTIRIAREMVVDFVHSTIDELMKDVRAQSKRIIVQDNKAIIKKLPELSREKVGVFISEIQRSFPRMETKHISWAIDVFAKMELARTGFELLGKLASLSPDDISGLDEILESWSITEAKIVLDELGKRLMIIEEMEMLIEKPAMRELQELQPLFEKALWIFGPEYEGCQFFSNKTLLTSLELELRDKKRIKELNRRPDFLVLPNATIGIYSRDGFDDMGEARGVDKVLLVELKGAESTIGVEERRQGEDYAKIIRDTGKFDKGYPIKCFVLGTHVDASHITVDEELTEVTPKAFADVLRMAHQRTFHLIEKIKEARNITIGDSEVNEILAQKELDDEYKHV